MTPLAASWLIERQHQGCHTALSLCIGDKKRIVHRFILIHTIYYSIIVLVLAITNDSIINIDEKSPIQSTGKQLTNCTRDWSTSAVLQKTSKICYLTATIGQELSFNYLLYEKNVSSVCRTYLKKSILIICGPVYDNIVDVWRGKINRELQDELGPAPIGSFISAGRQIQNGLVTWCAEIRKRRLDRYWNRRPTGKMPRGQPRKSWTDGLQWIKTLRK